MRRVLVLSLLFASPAFADDPKEAKESKESKEPAKDAKAPHPEGDYGGVVPGRPRRPEPTKKPKRPPPKGTLAWIGFEAKNGSAEVFLQSIAGFEVAQHVENGTLVVNLSGVNKLGQNTWRPIDTHFFDSPLARITAKRVSAAKASKDHPAHGAGIEVRIAFKNAKDAKEGALRSATEADGMYYAYLAFAGTTSSEPTLAEPEK